jgi:hypothetical protein
LDFIRVKETPEELMSRKREAMIQKRHEHHSETGGGIRA